MIFINYKVYCNIQPGICSQIGLLIFYLQIGKPQAFAEWNSPRAAIYLHSCGSERSFPHRMLFFQTLRGFFIPRQLILQRKPNVALFHLRQGDQDFFSLFLCFLFLFFQLTETLHSAETKSPKVYILFLRSSNSDFIHFKVFAVGWTSKAITAELKCLVHNLGRENNR